MTARSPGFRVTAKRCDQCLFGKNKIVSDRRRSEVLESCIREDRFFICHKSTIRDPTEEACCRGFYDEFPAVGAVQRFGRALKVVRFVDAETGEEVPER